MTNPAHWPHNQNDWQGRDQAQAMEDHVPPAPPGDVDYWERTARCVLRDMASGMTAAHDGAARMYRCVVELARIAHDRDRPTEARHKTLVPLEVAEFYKEWMRKHPIEAKLYAETDRRSEAELHADAEHAMEGD